ncbi:MAG: hypothetical protein AAFV88_22870, partial [Planctomycetota bacterium]
PSSKVALAGLRTVIDLTECAGEKGNPHRHGTALARFPLRIGPAQLHSVPGIAAQITQPP